MRFEGVRSVKLALVVGKAEIEGWDEGYVEVSYDLHGDDVGVETKVRSDTLLIAEKPRRKFFNRLGKGNRAEIKLRVPKNVTVNVNDVNGTVKGKNARFKGATTVNGEVSLKNCEVEMLKSVNGRIEVHLPVAGPLNVSTVNGSIEINIEELEGDVNVSCVNGNITLRLTDFCDARIKVKRVNGDVKLVGIDPKDPIIGTGDYEVRISTVNGDVRVELI